jgi:DNA-binding NarL/FixJ family response regulator
LIVDDDPGVCFALRRLLESRGAMRALVAQSADEAEAAVASGDVDAMVLDYHLFGMRGDAFYHRMCERQPSLASRTVFITGDLSPQANEAITATGRPILLKPFLASELLLTLRTLAAGAAGRDVRIA